MVKRERIESATVCIRVGGAIDRFDCLPSLHEMSSISVC